MTESTHAVGCGGGDAVRRAGVVAATFVCVEGGQGTMQHWHSGRRTAVATAVARQRASRARLHPSVEWQWQHAEPWPRGRRIKRCRCSTVIRLSLRRADAVPASCRGVRQTAQLGSYCTPQPRHPPLRMISALFDPAPTVVPSKFHQLKPRRNVCASKWTAEPTPAKRVQSCGLLPPLITRVCFPPC